MPQYIYRCDSIVFYMLSLIYRYWLLVMYLSLCLLDHISRLAFYRIGLSLPGLGYAFHEAFYSKTGT